MFDLDKVRYKNILSVNSLCIPAGKVTCIIGESGGGKTTLLRLLNKLISPDTGEIRFHGVPLPQINAVMLRRKVAMLSQEPVIFPGTVRENLLAGLRFSESHRPAIRHCRTPCSWYVSKSSWLIRLNSFPAVKNNAWRLVVCCSLTRRRFCLTSHLRRWTRKRKSCCLGLFITTSGPLARHWSWSHTVKHRPSNTEISL